MRVWQPGGHLMSERGAKVDDWSWARTRRRVATLARLTAPYKWRTPLSIASLLAAPASALAPHLLAPHDLDDDAHTHAPPQLACTPRASLPSRLRTRAPPI